MDFGGDDVFFFFFFFRNFSLFLPSSFPKVKNRPTESMVATTIHPFPTTETNKKKKEERRRQDLNLRTRCVFDF